MRNASETVIRTIASGLYHVPDYTTSSTDHRPRSMTCDCFAKPSSLGVTEPLLTQNWVRTKIVDHEKGHSRKCKFDILVYLGNPAIIHFPLFYESVTKFCVCWFSGSFAAKFCICLCC